jgi:hypothetical protein
MLSLVAPIGNPSDEGRGDIGRGKQFSGRPRERRTGGSTLVSDGSGSPMLPHSEQVSTSRTKKRISRTRKVSTAFDFEGLQIAIQADGRT